MGNDKVSTVAYNALVISIHVPAWGTTSAPQVAESTKQNFNPRSRVGNDGNIPPPETDGNISIHVPAWGTTTCFSHVTTGYGISIHVPAWGTTEIRSTLNRPSGLFQSTFPRGERHRFGKTIFLTRISIHVPAWGTTVTVPPVHSPSQKFQSTFPRGERQYFLLHQLRKILFQSTFPRGERRRKDVLSAHCLRISIHVPAWGTTNVKQIDRLLLTISIHVPAWGTTDSTESIPTGFTYFNPRSRVGNDSFPTLFLLS